MAKFGEMPQRLQWLIVVGLFAGLTVAAYFLLYKSMADQNSTDLAALNTKLAENEQLRSYGPKLAELDRDLERLREQLERMQRILPDEKLADQFMHLMQEKADNAGILIRRYSSRPTATREYYVEAPFEMELDGPFYQVVGFFDKVRNLERIVNVSGLKIANVTKASDVGARRRYAYSPSATVAATFTATTFFSKEGMTQPAAAAAAAPAKK